MVFLRHFCKAMCQAAVHRERDLALKKYTDIDTCYLHKDRLFGDDPAGPHNVCRILDGPHGKLFSTCFMAGGEGLHPMAVFCHGYPGNEENMDVAHALQRVGFHVMTFHYSGSWGSGGDFSLQHCIDDTQFVIDTVRNNAEYQADPENIFLFGQSMGGFVVSHVTAARTDIRAAVAAVPADFGQMEILSHQSEQAREGFLSGLKEGDGWLAGTSIEKMELECQLFARGRCFTDLVATQDLPMLIIGAEYDTLVSAEEVVEPWASRLQELHGEKIEYACLPTDHMLSDMRCRLTEMTAEFFYKELQ